ncbi:MAG: phenylalanine--tRNA ligase subunit beta [Thermodesulfobacteriota bacterium]
MKFTLNWLREYLPTDLDAATIAARLSMLGLEVDAVQSLAPDLSGVVVARVESVQRHPNADKLTLCDVSVGSSVLKRVVCGAPNVRAGLVTAMALPGAVLPGGFTIKPTKIRGEASEGMLCSAKELGMSEEHAGILEITADVTPGQPIVAALGLDDTLIEVDLTPNRPDCASVIGIAREVAAFAGATLKKPVTEVPQLTGQGLPFSVQVEAVEDCPRYAARMVRNVKIGPSPEWLRQRLLAVGLRPINNVVDITNFVMLEYGQPLHAFDFDKLKGGCIVVRKARAGETIETLDGTSRQLDPEMLLICDAEQAVAVAGVMGGANSEVSDTTTTILLESACFNPVTTRRTAGRLNMNTDASYRFERGVDPQGAPVAMERAMTLIAGLAGGEIVADGIDFCEGVKAPLALTLRVGRTCDVLGMALDAAAIARTLESIEIRCAVRDSETITVQVPSFRVDLEREIDLIEEVARLIGYNEIPTTLPLVPMRFPEREAVRSLRQELATVMVALGFHEAVNYSFVAPQHADLLGLPAEDARRRTVSLLNPLAEDQSVMRTTLLPGLLENARRNIYHQQPDVRLFELGKVFCRKEAHEQPEEEERLAAVLTGRRHPHAPLLYDGEAKVDLFDLKGVVEELRDRLRLPQLQLVAAPSAQSYADSGLAMAIVADGQVIGELGRINATVQKGFGIKQELFYLDLSCRALLALAAAPRAFAPLPKFPAVRWDVAVVVPEQVVAGEMVAAITASGAEYLEQVELFDVFQGKNIGPGLKSVALAMTYRAADRTLDDETVGKVHQKLIDLLLSRFHGQLREA